ERLGGKDRPALLRVRRILVAGCTRESGRTPDVSRRQLVGRQRLVPVPLRPRLPARVAGDAGHRDAAAYGPRAGDELLAADGLVAAGLLLLRRVDLALQLVVLHQPSPPVTAVTDAASIAQGVGDRSEHRPGSATYITLALGLSSLYRTC